MLRRGQAGNRSAATEVRLARRCATSTATRARSCVPACAGRPTKRASRRAGLGKQAAPYSHAQERCTRSTGPCGGDLRGALGHTARWPAWDAMRCGEPMYASAQRAALARGKLVPGEGTSQKESAEIGTRNTSGALVAAAAPDGASSGCVGDCCVGKCVLANLSDAQQCSCAFLRGRLGVLAGL